MYRAYTVITPPFDVTSGGIRVMYGLYGWLLTRGQIVHLNAKYENADSIAIYPEIVHGNPAESNHVVRYILNRPGLMASGGIPGPTTFDSSDHLFTFSDMFKTKNIKPHFSMFLPIINTHLFTNQKKKRTQTAVFVGKGINKNIHPKEAIPIDRELAKDQKALADMLNECQVVYSYDPVSAMTEIARLCGCRVVLNQDVFTKDEYSNYEPGMNGVSWGEDTEVPLDYLGFKQHYGWLRKKFSERLSDFIELTQTT